MWVWLKSCHHQERESMCTKTNPSKLQEYSNPYYCRHCFAKQKYNMPGFSFLIMISLPHTYVHICTCAHICTYAHMQHIERALCDHSSEKEATIESLRFFYLSAILQKNTKWKAFNENEEGYRISLNPTIIADLWKMIKSVSMKKLT